MKKAKSHKGTKNSLNLTPADKLNIVYELMQVKVGRKKLITLKQARQILGIKK